MATSLAAQLSAISANSENSLNLKVQKAKHSKSLIFEPRIAASQSFDSLYAICHEGFEELCLLDGRFLEFQRDIFSEQSQEEDRAQMTALENSELNKRLESFLGLVGGRLRLNPAIKSVEWLVRRFRIHEQNTSFLLTTFLPYHMLPIFTSLLSILPDNTPQEYKFLHPFIRSLTAPPKHTIVQAATNNIAFASALNTYVLKISKARQHYPALLAFWAGVMTEAAGGMLDKSRSGRRGVQEQNEQDVILRLLPTLNEGLAMKKVPDFRVGCYMLLSIMASKGGLNDRLLSAMMEAVVLGWTTETTSPGLVCLSVLARYRGAKSTSKRFTKELLKIQNISSLLVDLAKQRDAVKLTYSFCLGLLDRLRKSGEVSGLPIIQKLVEEQVLSDPQIIAIINSLLVVACQIEDSSVFQEATRSHLASLLVSLVQVPGHVGSIVQGVFKSAEVDMDQLELKLNTSIRLIEKAGSPIGDVLMEAPDVEATRAAPKFSEMFQQLPQRTTSETSFLSHDASHIYPELCRAFLVSTTSATDLEMFDKAPLLRRESALEETLYFSFYMRIWCGPHPALARASALQMINRYLLRNKVLSFDIQAVLPYIIAALADTSTKVRSAAAELIITMHQRFPKAESKKKAKQPPLWAFADLYGPGKDTKDLYWLTTDITSRLLGELLVPALEECVLDATHVESLLEKALNGPRSSELPKNRDTARLPQSARTSILSFLASHVVHSPLYSVKLRLLTSLNRVRGVAGMTRTKVLLPVLQAWALLSESDVSKHCAEEKFDSTLFDNQALMTVTANDKEGLELLTGIIRGEVAKERPELLGAVFRRLQGMWSSFKGEYRLNMAQMLLDSAQSARNIVEESHASEGSADLLRRMTLSTDILISFLDQLPTAVTLADVAPATKRRRTSHGEVARTPLQDSKQLSSAIAKATFVLQLVDSSEPGKHPELLRGLFNVLAELQHFKSQVTSELAYLQCLALSSLLTILRAYKSNPNLKLDRSSVRADLLVDCVQKTASPQVQNAALLLIASLADTAPELVLHSVMPIFTFMGNSVLRQNDEYSAHVITQTIREVIPPLISSLREDKGNPVTGAAELLLSFVAAYEHVPQHRRRALFISLVQTLGPEEFLFALLAMMIDKYGPTESVKSFSLDLSAAFGVEVQLQSMVKYLQLIGDVLKPKPTVSMLLLGVNEELKSDPYQVALDQMNLLPSLLSQKRLIAQTGRILAHDDMDAARLRELYSTLLEDILALADTLKDEKLLHGACGDILESLLGLLSTSEFVKSVETLLDRPNESLRRKILRSLEVRIDQESSSDVASRLSMLGFLPQLTAIIRESKDVLYKLTAVACVDKISEKYGKKDLEVVAAAAETIASSHCLGQADARLQIMALLCLSSLVEILREGILPVLPTAIPKALEYIKAGILAGTEAQKLHNAGFAFISSLVQYLPYMVSRTYFDKLLEISHASAEGDLNDDADVSRVQCLQLAAKQIDAKIMFGALEKYWAQVVTSEHLALREFIDILSIAVEKQPKIVITKYVSTLAKIIQNALDLRRQRTLKQNESLDDDSIFDLEADINKVAIKVIYKLNDATFRPIFSDLIEWAAFSLPKKDSTGRNLQLQSLYGFMSLFFGDLKSIVTSYATYLLENAVDVLKVVNPKDRVSKDLWARVLQTLVKCFEHDQDDFWQSPSHFSTISPVLCGQLEHASVLPLAQELIPAIVELAAAADSPDHHKELNGSILKHMRSESTSVRLAAIKCEQALTDRLGEEWLSMLPEMLPFISELQEDDDDVVEKETHKWIVKIEGVLGESLDSMLQ